MTDSKNRPIYSNQTTLLIVDAEQTQSITVDSRLLENRKIIAWSLVAFGLLSILTILFLAWLAWHQRHQVTAALETKHSVQQEMLAMQAEMDDLKQMTSQAVQDKLKGLRASEKTVIALEEYLRDRGVDVADSQALLESNSSNPAPSNNKKINSAGGPIEAKLLTPIPFMQPYAKHVDNLLDQAQDLPLGYPHHGKLSSKFGLRGNPFGTGAQELHRGLDFKGKTGEPIQVTANGSVLFAGRESGYGLVVKVQHRYGFSTVYAHLSALSVKTGDAVQAGDIIGKLGSTGRSTGPHLHYEVRHKNTPYNPESFLSLYATAPKEITTKQLLIDHSTSDSNSAI